MQLWVPHYLNIPLLVAQSDRLGTVPRHLAEHFAALLPICITRLPLVQVRLIWHRQQRQVPRLQWLRGEISTIASGGRSEGRTAPAP